MFLPGVSLVARDIAVRRSVEACPQLVELT
jgi:hypothetical protein